MHNPALEFADTLDDTIGNAADGKQTGEKSLPGYRFFQYATFRIPEDSELPGNGQPKIYRELVFHRFYEGITSMFPLLTGLLGDEAIRSWVSAFIRSGCNAPTIRRMGGQFRDFLLNKPAIENDDSLHDMPNIPENLLADLLWYEWSQIDLLLRDYSGIRMHAHEQNNLQPFDWNRPVTKSASAVLKEIDFTVHRNDYLPVQEMRLLLYYDFEQKTVFYRELTTPAASFIEKLPWCSPEFALQLLAGELSFTPEETGEARILFSGLMQELYELKILIPRQAE